jgi:small subunit ribosomal protein S17e
VDRIKRLSFEVLNEHKSKFGEDFGDNKKVLNQITIIRSKGLKNKVAGYITRFNKKQTLEEKYKQEHSNDSSTTEEDSSLEMTEDVSETVEEITLTNEEVNSIVDSKESTEEKSE